MNKEMPLLSVIIPVYNTEQYVEKCLESVLNQSYKNIEIIIMDDGSKGNIRELAKTYMEDYKNIKLVSHEENKGLFLARVTGVENSSGDYIAFLDSDDSISIDFYRKLIQKAESTGSDMVAGDFLLEYEDKHYEYFNFSNLRLMDINLKGEEILKTLFLQHGLDYSWHVVWNKIYARSLWDKCYPFFKEQTKHLVMCEDIAFSIGFYSFATHFTNTHDDYYFYLQNSNSSTKEYINSEQIFKKLDDIDTAFSFATYILENTTCYEKYGEKLSEWEGFLLRNWKTNIQRTSLSKFKKEKLNYRLEELNHGKSVDYEMQDDYFFHSVKTSIHYLELEKIKQGISSQDCKYVSFDIFDTLIVRPFWEPTDLFCLMNPFVNELLNINDQIDFKLIRVDSERIAREKKRLTVPSAQDITLEEIYNEIRDTYGIEREKLEKIKEKEIELELSYCNVRNIGKELYDFALAVGKKVICISDMYLTKEIIEKILQKNGYTKLYNVYVSSEIMLSKYSGDLYKYVKKDLKEKDKRKFIHIGDNWQSDVIMANKCGWLSFHLPKAVDMFANRNMGIYSGKYFHKMFESVFGTVAVGTAMNFFGIRCMLAVIANKAFDNPFAHFNQSSDFNANPYFIGYFALGMHMFAISKWLIEDTRHEGYNTIHFMARDGFLPKRTFEILNTVYKENVKTDYVYLSRKAVLPLMMQNPDDFYGLIRSINIFSQSPKKIIKLFNNMISEDKLKSAEKIVEDTGLKYEVKFKSCYEYEKFMNIFISNFYEKENYIRYKAKMKEFFDPIFEGKNATFDVGYSVRIESTLVNNFGYDITPFYIHINNDLAYERSVKTGIKIQTLYNYAPAVTGVVREQIMSELSPSCIGYTYKREKSEPIFEDYELNYQTYFMTSTMQSAAVEFVRDIVNIFGEDIKQLTFRNNDASIPLEFILHYSERFDRLIFNASYFEDDLGEGKNKIRITDFWNGQTQNMYGNYVNSNGFFIETISPKWKKFIALAMLDRDTMKEKVKNRFASRPVILKIMKVSYSTLRKSKRIFFKSKHAYE